MADTVHSSFGTMNSTTKFIRTGRRSLINPGDHKDVTPYYSYTLYQSWKVGTLIDRYLSGSTWYDTSLPLDPGNRGEGLAIWPLSTGYTVPPQQHSKYAEAYNVSMSKLFSKVLDDKMSDFNAGMFVAEFGQTAEHLANTAVRIRKAVSALRRGRLAKAYEALGVRPPKGARKLPRGHVSKNAANYWTEASYAWIPLYHDAIGSAQKLADIVVGRPMVCKVRGRTVRNAFNDYQNGNGLSVDYVTEFDKICVEIGIAYTVSDSAVAMASSLGLTNPFLLAYESIPLSFALDWFIPIGNFLEELSAFHGLEFQDGWISTLYNRTYICASSGYQQVYRNGWRPDGTYGPTGIRTSSGNSYVKKTSGFQRHELNSFPLPNFPRPSLESFTSSWKRIVTSIALIRQRV